MSTLSLDVSFENEAKYVPFCVSIQTIDVGGEDENEVQRQNIVGVTWWCFWWHVDVEWWCAWVIPVSTANSYASAPYHIQAHQNGITRRPTTVFTNLSFKTIIILSGNLIRLTENGSLDTPTACWRWYTRTRNHQSLSCRHISTLFTSQHWHGQTYTGVEITNRIAEYRTDIFHYPLTNQVP